MVTGLRATGLSIFVRCHPLEIKLLSYLKKKIQNFIFIQVYKCDVQRTVAGGGTARGPGPPNNLLWLK